MKMDGHLPVVGKQGSVEWLFSRAGHVTASRFKDVIAVLKSGKPSEARQRYMLDVVAERLTGAPVQNFVNAAMQWGTENEPFARGAYEAATGNLVAEAPFITHPDVPWCGASPDGLVDEDGAIEIKCPTTPTHLSTLLDGMSADHQPQVQGVLWVTGRAWADFISFDPRLPANLQLYVQRVQRDEDYIAALAAAVRNFNEDVDAFMERLNGKR